MNDAQVETHRHGLKQLRDADLWRAYRLYLDGLELDENGAPPKASKIQYFLSVWREIRQRYYKPKV